MNYKYNFTFIIPHKNIPDLLLRCVASIPKRIDTQIVIVDDNSDNEVVEILRHTYHSDALPFKGLGSLELVYDHSAKRQGHARNVGLEHADGKWIIFADSDDYFFYSLNQAMEDCLNSDADIIYYKSTNLDCENYQVSNIRSGITNSSINKYLNGEIDGEDFIRFRHPAPWGKFIRHSVIQNNNIKFPEIPIAEDFEFSYKCGYYAKKVKAYDISIYCLTTRQGNVTASDSPKLRNIVVQNEMNFLQFMREHNLQTSPSYQIIEQDVFAILHHMYTDNDGKYSEAKNHFKEIGFSDNYIIQGFKRIQRANRNAQIVALLPSWLRRIIK